jgi:hypothetical protein
MLTVGQVGALKRLFPQGSPYVLGPLDGDHWCNAKFAARHTSHVTRHTAHVTRHHRYVFLVDMVQRPPHTETDQMLNVCVLDP